MLRDDELIIDYFAGGGGASTGLEEALGRSPDVAKNHDAEAVAMHSANHPATVHLCENVWTGDPRDVQALASRHRCSALGIPYRLLPIGLWWFSPDCKHFSKAKGSKPVEKGIRDLAWVVVHCAKLTLPRIIMLENVEEFRDWGPLIETEDGKLVPCPLSKGITFKRWVRALRKLGYVVDWRELRACDYGAPTIRKRLFVIARRDGVPIAWPAPTHAKDGAGGLQRWRAAAEIIDWSLPVPSIFDTADEIKAKFGIRAIRPLAEATMARIAKGTMRYVVNSPKPFIVQVNHGGESGGRVHDVGAPAPTSTGARGEALVTPFVSYGQQGGNSRDAGEPLHTITASDKDTNAVVAPVVVNVANSKTTGRGPNTWSPDEPLRTQTPAGGHAIATPFITKFNRGATGHPMGEPLATITAHTGEDGSGGASPLGVVAPLLVGCGGRAGQSPPRSGRDPVWTQTAKADASVVAPYLVPRYGERPGQEPRTRSLEHPAPAIVPTANEGSIVAPVLTAYYGEGKGGNDRSSDSTAPLPTDTAGGNRHAVVAAFLAQHNTDMVGHSAEKPVSTIVDKGCTQGLVAAHLINHRGSDRRDGPVDQPAPTSSAGGNHAAAVYAFLAKYYGTGVPSQPVDVPLHTVTAKPRHGVVTVTIEGEPYYIADIGMRMLTPRERFNAQGFPPTYKIEIEIDALDRKGRPYRKKLPLDAQGRMCGNSVSPPLAAALARSNASASTVAMVAAE